MKDHILDGDNKILHCPYCDTEFSGNAGDYWDYPENHVFMCEHCDAEMELVNKTVTITYK